ncbi:TcpQ domain-containing protein [Parapusillimonas sp. JC17]|uniref:TcpQ domain-containing protein n=1 Tax=Parapusillimonas sp. JC17 TaxID=3445768 RepID=UPI003FA02D95
MSRIFAIFLACATLAACTPSMRWPWPAPASQTAPTQGARYSFAWRLSGDRAVAPLQVFDDGRQTWLQFSESQAVPAIFARGAKGDQLLSYARQGPYVVLPGVWPELILRGGSLVGHVRREAPAQAAGQQEPPGSVSSDPAPVSVSQAIEAPDPIPTEAQTAALTAQSFPDPESQAPSFFQAGPQDRTMRAALDRWARSAGWTFEPEHWVVDVDIPLAGSARFEPEFKSAVRELLASTELGERPLQPCFYSNRVLRIVPYAQPCDRSVGGRTS